MHKYTHQHIYALMHVRTHTHTERGGREAGKQGLLQQGILFASPAYSVHIYRWYMKPVTEFKEKP